MAGLDDASHRMPATDVVAIVTALDAAGVTACLSGGWGVDALVGRQTRPHSDLDLWLPATEFDLAERVFVGLGIDRPYPSVNDRPWNFVVHDGRRRVDLHLYELVDGGARFHYGERKSGHLFPIEALAGRGLIDGHPVRCEDAAWSLRFHTGYPPRAVDRADVTALCVAFGWEIPAGYEVDPA